MEQVIFNSEGVIAIKELNIRKLGLDLRMDLTIDVNKDMSVEQGHIITIKVKRNLIKKFPQIKGILIHVEPFLGKTES